MKISACLITKNEEQHLSRCIESFKDSVNEIVVVDTGSDDSTVEIAKNALLCKCYDVMEKGLGTGYRVRIFRNNESIRHWVNIHETIQKGDQKLIIERIPEGKIIITCYILIEFFYVFVFDNIKRLRIYWRNILFTYSSLG